MAKKTKELANFCVKIADGVFIDQLAAEAVISPSGALMLLGPDGKLWRAWSVGAWQSVDMVATYESTQQLGSHERWAYE